MRPESIQLALATYKDKIPSNNLYIFKSALENASDESASNLALVKTYDTTATLLFSIFLGGIGIDRFVLGDTVLGVIKILLSVLTMTFSILFMASIEPIPGGETGSVGLAVAMILTAMVLSIWCLVDIFLCYKKAKKKNFDNLMNALK